MGLANSYLRLIEAQNYFELLYNVCKNMGIFPDIVGKCSYNKGITDFVSQHFSLTIGETWTCFTYHDTKSPKIFKYFAVILPLEEISKKGGKMRKTSHEKMTHLVKSCVTMTDLMDKFYEATELSDVICDECTKSSSTTIKMGGLWEY